MLKETTTWKHIRRSPYQSLAAILIMILTLFIASVFSLTSLGMDKILKFVEAKPQITAFFKDEIDETYGIYIDSDEERQRVLEAAGWTFCRIKYADWTDEKFDRNVVVNTIVELLK